MRGLLYCDALYIINKIGFEVVEDPRTLFGYHRSSIGCVTVD